MPWVTKILVFLRSTPLGPMKDNIKYLNFGLHIQTKVPLYKQYFFSKWTSDQLNISLTFLSSKFDAPVIKTLERIKFSSNQNIGEDESNFDEKNLEETFNWSEVHSEKKYYVLIT